MPDLATWLLELLIVTSLSVAAVCLTGLAGWCTAAVIWCLCIWRKW